MRRVKVTVRSRPISGDRRTLYLDYYPAVRIPETMKMMRQETLGMYLYDKPKNQIQKRHNESTLAQAEAIRCLRVQAVINEEFGFLDKQRLNTDFLEYFRKETLMRNCSWASCYKHFKTFVGGKCTFAQINVDLCVKFREYLLKAPRFDTSAKALSVNTASGYYRKFRSLLAIALRDKLLQENINLYLDRIDVKPNKIEFLTQQELLNLSKAPCEIPVLKKASLFSCLTGLRYSDVQRLEWSNIVPNLEGTGYNIRTRTKKTQAEISLPLSPDALELCGERSDGVVFIGLNRNMLNAPLRRWISEAGITKHITFHSFRHTYAVLQLASGTDIYTVSKMLSHKHVTTTEIYLDLLEETKSKTIGRIQIHKDHDPDAA